MKKYYSYIYLDNVIIEDLYPQVFGDTVKTIISKSIEDKANADVNANILNIIGAEIDASEHTITSENREIVTSIARKAQLLINYFKEEETSISNIIQKNIPFKESIYFVGKSTFFLRDIFDKNTGKSLFVYNTTHKTLDNEYVIITDNAVLVLETGDDEYVYRYQKGGYAHFYSHTIEILMHLSNIKIRKDVRHLTSVIKKRKSFNFYVFGELICENANLYKISPFAVWQ